LQAFMITGESMPNEAGPGCETYAGTLVRRGEAVAMVTATGTHTKSGRSAELVCTAHVVSSQQKAIFRVVRNLAGLNGLITVVLIGYARDSHGAAAAGSRSRNFRVGGCLRVRPG